MNRSIAAKFPIFAMVAACALPLAFSVNCAFAASAPDGSSSEVPKRIVVVGGPLTEIVFALGAGDRVVGVDTSSLYPQKAMALPKVGYQRALAVEGVLSLQPDLVLAGAETGPPAAIEQLREAGVRVEVLPTAYTRDVVAALILDVAKLLDRTEAAPAILSAVDTELQASATAVAQVTRRPRVLFVYARGAGSLLVGGRDTAAHALIELAGATNAVDDFAGYKPLSAESVVLADPEVILMSERGIAELGGSDGVLAVPGIDGSRAARMRRVVTLDDAHLLGFGPRLGDAVASLVRQLHPEVDAARNEE